MLNLVRDRQRGCGLTLWYIFEARVSVTFQCNAVIQYTMVQFQ